MALIADVFPKLRIPENVLRQMSKKPCFTGPFEKQHGKRAKTLFKSEPQHLCIFIDQCEGNWIGKSLS